MIVHPLTGAVKEWALEPAGPEIEAFVETFPNPQREEGPIRNADFFASLYLYINNVYMDRESLKEHKYLVHRNAAHRSFFDDYDLFELRSVNICFPYLVLKDNELIGDTEELAQKISLAPKLIKEMFRVDAVFKKLNQKLKLTEQIRVTSQSLEGLDLPSQEESFEAIRDYEAGRAAINKVRADFVERFPALLQQTPVGMIQPANDQGDGPA